MMIHHRNSFFLQWNYNSKRRRVEIIDRLSRKQVCFLFDWDVFTSWAVYIKSLHCCWANSLPQLSVLTALSKCQLRERMQRRIQKNSPLQLSRMYFFKSSNSDSTFSVDVHEFVVNLNFLFPCIKFLYLLYIFLYIFS